jgi:ABC-type antimicrobial peptide transport system permease subunit
MSNNKNITATIMFVILATLSMSVSCVVHCMLDKKSYGTMVVCGMKKKEIIKMTVFYNGFLFISSSVASWLLRQKQIFGKINPADSQLVTGVFRLNNIAGHMYFVPILILVMIIFMTLITSVMPAIIISRMTPVDMIFERD